MSKARDHLSTVANLAVIVAVLALVIHPDGGIRGWWRERMRDKAARERIRELWPLVRERQQSRLGSRGGAVHMLEFADYQCPYCAAVHDDVLQTLKRDSTIAIGLVHYPLTNIHRHARGAARASICAEQQGRFEEMHDFLFSSSDWKVSPSWVEYANAVGVPDTQAFRTCLDAPTTTARLQRDMSLADSFGISATPTFVSPLGMRSGVLDAAGLRVLIQH
jgi:protein-disulfide isomerase